MNEGREAKALKALSFYAHKLKMRLAYTSLHVTRLWPFAGVC